MKLGDIFPEPFPEPFNGVQVGAIAGKRDEPKTKDLGFLLSQQSPMPGSTIPNDDHLTVSVTYPLSDTLQKHNRMVLVAVAFVPDEALTIGKIIDPIPVI